ncbi:hypothetical protein AVEN_195414-1 [Araneus ventricosus]|uniref:Uncharacterized protein n=1 Tax=Araneus ventricosus TaxID=182803 RepID=A0A4Y2K5P0_ARAVE|nr:hypothetical protein AVEN_195414-1 [Araneus ventricosus]
MLSFETVFHHRSTGFHECGEVCTDPASEICLKADEAALKAAEKGSTNKIEGPNHKHESCFVQCLQCKTRDQKICAQIGVVMATGSKECIGYIFINAEIGPEGDFVRRFVIPAVNFGATDYVDLIDRQAFYVTPPPVLRQISSHELLKMI